MSDNFVRQALPMKYMDNDTLEKELNRILGDDGWRVSEVCSTLKCGLIWTISD